MCYYLGYYLVPSGLGKWFGLDSVKYISFAWLWFGLFLSLLWIHQIFRSFNLFKRTVATFMIWSGAYVAVMIPVLEKLFDKPSFLGSNSVFIGRGEMMLHYSSILKSVVEGPQHAITAILGGALFMALGCTSASVGIFSLFTIGSLFWSPFVSIGLAPFTLYTYYLYVTERGFIAFMKKQLPMLVMMLIGFLPLVLYTLGSSATQMDSNRFFTHTTASYPILLYGLFIVVSAGIWILFFRKRLFELDAAMVCISYGTLSVLALFQIGYFNDLNNRASVPSLFIIGISIIHLILKSSFNRPVNYLLLAGLAFWLLNTASIFTYLYQTFITVNKAPENTISNPYNRHTNNDYYDYMEILYPMNSQEVIKQYSLNSESIFQKYLLRKSENDN
ncbi:hypothetical protein [Siphonobacter sp. SORGH_AS_1065]|uniref:hypothetical protein n=1 Tax=Siphonobacter sp. SORGH_AS_1065 TaxID=3041795 RepID=UPI0027D7A803|nr:hypothetical protein [Siphonobacter sp. SORGH_AS_1065]